MFVICRNGVALTLVYGGESVRMVPCSSDTSSRPSGRNFIAVGSSSPPWSRISFWNELAFATFTSTAADSLELPAVSTARARSVCAPFGTDRVSQASAYGAVESDRTRVDAVDLELDVGDPDVVRGIGGDVHDAAHRRAVRRR